MSFASRSVCLARRPRILETPLSFTSILTGPLAATHSSSPNRTALSHSRQPALKRFTSATRSASSTSSSPCSVDNLSTSPTSQDIAASSSHAHDTASRPNGLLNTIESEQPVLLADRDSLNPADVAQHARQRFGDRLPDGALTAREQAVYERLYGKPLAWSHEHENLEDSSENLLENEDPDVDSLLRENSSGEWEVVEDALGVTDHDEADHVLGDGNLSSDDIRLSEDIKSQVMGDKSTFFQEFDDLATDLSQRAHPFTLSSRSGTEPATIQISKDNLAGPTAVMLSDVANKHLDEAAERLLGGKGLPYGVGTPTVSKQLPQKPIPLTASQGRMTSMEADVFMAALAPGFYASCLSALVEVRKRLGSDWIENLLYKEGGPQILDAGGGGAGILAWRDIVDAEKARRDADERQPGPSYGKSTVLTGSDALRLRASVLLDNTTFLPRLPDYMHVQNPSSEQRKAYDIIVAPYALWHLKEEHLRRSFVENLWRLLSPRGGILLLLEKGVPRGFEVIAGARQHLLKDIFARKEDSSRPLSHDPRRNVPGTIIAPCTNDSKCPMYPIPGVSRQRKDYCHFSQKYVRPQYYQRMLGAKSRNHDEVRYSYVAVQKGAKTIDTSVNQLSLGEDATQRAFQGYDIDDEDMRLHQGQKFPGTISVRESTIGSEGQPESKTAVTTPPPETKVPPRGLLPRLILPPLKRQGHVILDVCTPSGTLERWTVARSFGQQAYRDARKARWGDLWALGAKQRVARRVRLGLAGLDQEQETSPGLVEGSISKSKQRIQRRKEEQARGREKARLRRRAEKAAIGF